MSSSFINIGKIGFWTRAPLVEAVQICLINEIENQTASKDWLFELKKELALQSLPIIYGGMSLCLEEFATTKERKKILLDLLESIIKKIKNEDYLTGRKLHQFRYRAMEILSQEEKTKFKSEKEFLSALNESQWSKANIKPYKTNYEKTFLLVQKLLKGELTTTAASPIDYY